MTAPVLAKNTDHGRFYCHPTRPGAEVPSITNIIGCKAKPLFRAGMREAATYASENVARLGALTKDEVFKLVSNPPKREDAPSVIGDIVHSWAERFIKGDPPSTEEVNAAPLSARQMWAKWHDFVAWGRTYHSLEFTGSEFTVWSDRWAYAGTADFSMMLSGRHILCDIKTGKRSREGKPYPEVAMQLAAIQRADFVLTPDGGQAPVPQYDGYAVLSLRPRSKPRLHPVAKIEEAFDSFLALKRVFDWNVFHAPQAIGFAPEIG